MINRRLLEMIAAMERIEKRIADTDARLARVEQRLDTLHAKLDLLLAAQEQE